MEKSNDTYLSGEYEVQFRTAHCDRCLEAARTATFPFAAARTSPLPLPVGRIHARALIS
jgi:hypothetical protein